MWIDEEQNLAPKGFPVVHFYDQDFVDLYDQTWIWIQDLWKTIEPKGKEHGLFYPDMSVISQYEALMSTFFLVYSNQHYSPYSILDYFYSKQESDGAIRSHYDITTGKAVDQKNNPLGMASPLFAFVELNLYHKIGNKKRLKEIIEPLEKHFTWVESQCKQKNGLYSVPVEATPTPAPQRKGVEYPVDFNAQMAINALYLSLVGDLLNDKEISFKYKRIYFTIKTRMNTLMWSEKDSYYYDLDKKENHIEVKTLASYWTLLAELPTEERAKAFIEKLKDDKIFGSDNPFPTLAMDQKGFTETGEGYQGSVFPDLTFMVLKGLEKYDEFEFARECAIRHIYFMIDTLHLDNNKGGVFEAYLPSNEGPSTWKERPEFPRKHFIHTVGLATIALMIENVIGFSISLPRKTVDWTMPTLEVMGIEDLSLRRNMITIITNKRDTRGWEVRLESEKLYYFTIKILDTKKRKTLPIPSGRCSMLIDKL